MRNSTWLLLLAAFSFGLMTSDVDARGHHHHKNHNYVWHNGAHYKPRGHHHHHHRRHHKKHHRKPAPPPIVVAHVYVGSQTMTVAVNDFSYGSWQVSTRGNGFHTPRGVFRAQRMARVYYSKKYDNSPMPNSVFFAGGNAIHGTYHYRSLGRAVSHGCVRLLPEHAAELFALVERYGMARTRVIVSD